MDTVIEPSKFMMHGCILLGIEGTQHDNIERHLTSCAAEETQCDINLVRSQDRNGNPTTGFWNSLIIIFFSWTELNILSVHKSG